MESRVTEARQGHLYRYKGLRVIALANGPRVKVVQIENGWPGRKHIASACHLEPQPMVYYHGQVPG